MVLLFEFQKSKSFKGSKGLLEDLSEYISLLWLFKPQMETRRADIIIVTKYVRKPNPEGVTVVFNIDLFLLLIFSPADVFCFAK